jgi:hypothetical protein
MFNGYLDIDIDIDHGSIYGALSPLDQYSTIE